MLTRFEYWNWKLYKVRGHACILDTFMLKRREWPTHLLSRPSPDTAMLFAHFRCTHPPSPVLASLLTQNLSPKDIAR